MLTLVQELRNKKWRHIRDAYLKYITKEKNGASGSEGTKKKPYAYAKAMAFLTPTFKKKKQVNLFFLITYHYTIYSISFSKSICLTFLFYR